MDGTEQRLADELVTGRASRRSKRRIAKRLVVLLVCGVGLYAVAPGLIEVFSAAPRLVTLDLWWFIGMLVAQTGSFVALWALIGICIHSRDWFVIATTNLTSTAVGRIVPGGGAASAAMNLRMLTTAGVPASTAATGVTAFSLISTGMLFAMPSLALPSILAGVPVSSGLAQAAWIGIGFFVVLFATAMVLVTSDRPLRVTGRLLQRAATLFRSKRALASLPERLIEERNLIRKTLGAEWPRALGAAVIKTFLEFMALMGALLAVGASPDPGLVVLAFSAASVLTTVPITPGGLGFVEAGLTGTLVLAGVSAGDAALATLAFRLASYWVPMLLGVGALFMFRARYKAL
ncbi:MAG: flippase-like domain-containing protein [Actinomycetota bacterium]|nr:flippase-like domain-containing protein [Actinomycetota bacterium]